MGENIALGQNDHILVFHQQCGYDFIMYYVLCAQSPVIPPTVSDQIRLWEMERDRLEISEGMYVCILVIKNSKIAYPRSFSFEDIIFIG